MAKIPSRKFPKTKRKLESPGFRKSERKIPSRKPDTKGAKISTRKPAKSKIPADEEPTGPAKKTPERSADTGSREERLADLRSQAKSLRPASELEQEANDRKASENDRPKQ